MVPTGTQVGPEIPTMAPESADLGHLWAVLGHLGAVGRKSTNAGFIFRTKIAWFYVFTVIGARPEVRSGRSG